MRRSNEASWSSRTSGGRLQRSLTVSLAIFVGAVCLAACGSSSSPTTPPSSAPPSSANASSSTGSASACVNNVNALVKKETSPMPELLPTSKIDMSALKGKTVWYISPSQATGYALAISQGLQAAGKKAGVNVQIFDGKGTPTLFSQGVEQAVAQHAAAIWVYGFNPSLVPVGLKEAKAAHIPVMTALTGVTGTDGGMVFEAINENLAQEPTYMADYAAYLTGCKVNAATSFDPLYPSLVTERNTIKTELAKLCPSTCSVLPAQMALATMATTLAPSVQSLIQTHSNLNAIFATFDQAATYEQPAVASSGSKVKIIGTDGLPPNVDSVRSGGAQVADVAFVPPAYLGWLGLDQMARAVLGKPIGSNGAAYTLPVQTIDKANVGTSDAISALFPNYANYQSQFSALWGM
jgi:ribose transport system substrate-binding protein